MGEAQGLEGRNLVALYSVQSAQGTPVTPATSLGILSFESAVPNGLRAIFGLGSYSALFLKPGISRATARLSNILVQSVGIFTDICTRDANGVLPWITLGLGYTDDDGTTHLARQIADCKVGEWDVGLEASDEGGLLTANMSFVGIKVTEITSLEEANLAQTPLAHYEAILTKGGAAWEADAFRLSVNENLRTKTPIPGAAPSADEARLVKYIKEGKRDVSGSIDRAARSQINLQADSLAEFAIQLALEDAAGGSSPNAVTFAISGAKFGDETMRGGPDQELGWGCPFVAKSVAIS